MFTLTAFSALTFATAAYAGAIIDLTHARRDINMSLGLPSSVRATGTGYFGRPWPGGKGSFFHNFVNCKGLPRDVWAADDYANGQPFANGWSKNNLYCSGEDGLALKLERKQFKDPGSATGEGRTYDFTSGEVRTVDFYGYGTYSSCFKPSAISGTSAAFYVHTGPHDTPSNAGRWYNDHNEIDLEFIGKDTKVIQSNYFSRPKVPGANSGSGNEELHDLGFDASKEYAAYAFRWTHGKIEWFVNGKQIRAAFWKADKPTPLQSYSTMRVVFNKWPVNKQAEEWAGPLDPYFKVATANYKWVKFDQGENAEVPSQC